MLRSDAQKPKEMRHDNSFSNISTITTDIISRIEQDLETYDLISIVFLLYDVPDTALQRLIVLQRVSKDIGATNLNLLSDWAQHAQTRPTWKYELLEALTICQVYSVIKKLGFHVVSVKKHYLPENLNVSVYLNPMKKVLYKLCDNMTSDNFMKLKSTLNTYDIDTAEYETCELVFLELMCKKFITVDQKGHKCQVEKLAKIVEKLSGLKRFATALRETESQFNDDSRSKQPSTSTPTSGTDNVNGAKDDNCKADEDDGRFAPGAFEDLFTLMTQLNLEQPTVRNLKSDTTKLDSGSYAIKNSKRVGVCYIINQEDFHPSKESIESNLQSNLEGRLGSSRDKLVLENTMASLNFEVICHRNLNHKKMLQHIKEIVQYRVHYDDSMFMLCILSHGVRGHVYASDTVKVKIETIQSLLDDSFQSRELEIPKIMILQACQVNNEDVPPAKFVADSPTSYYLRKSHFLIFWATAPELEAYRDEKKGSIFIQILCYYIRKHASHEHLFDIFTKVNEGVAQICARHKCDQVPIFESTLRKKLYLQIPE